MTNYINDEEIIPSPGSGEPDEEDPREYLYNRYGNHIVEDHESFCNRMADTYGENWITILTRRPCHRR